MNIFILKIIFFMSVIGVLYFLLPKLNLKLITWIIVTPKRRRNTFIILFILSVIAGGIINMINIKFIKVLNMIPIAIFISIYTTIWKLDDLKEK